MSRKSPSTRASRITRSPASCSRRTDANWSATRRSLSRTSGCRSRRRTRSRPPSTRQARSSISSVCGWSSSTTGSSIRCRIMQKPCGAIRRICGSTRSWASGWPGRQDGQTRSSTCAGPSSAPRATIRVPRTSNRITIWGLSSNNRAGLKRPRTNCGRRLGATRSSAPPTWSWRRSPVSNAISRGRWRWSTAPWTWRRVPARRTR